jgi:hypothetical protein
MATTIRTSTKHNLSARGGFGKTERTFGMESVSRVLFRSEIQSIPKGVEMKLARVRTSFLTALLVVVALLAFGTMSALAQDATPTGGAEPAHPVHIHSGTCDALGDVVVPLNDIVTYNITNSFSFGPAATPEADSMATPLPSVSVTETTPVLVSVTHIDANVADFVTGGFAINAHESAENIQNYIACGNIPACTSPACAAVSGVSIVLAPQNDSGYFGAARIDADPDGGAIVAIYLFQSEMPASS